MRSAVTRPDPQASRTAERLIAAGQAPLLAPLLVFRPLPSGPIDTTRFDALAITSRSAIAALAASAPDRAGMEALRTLPVFAVGEATAGAARAAGFARVSSADGDAAALAALLAERLAPGARILHLTGADQAADLGALSRPHGLAVEVRIMYRMEAAGALPAPLAEAAARAEVDAVLVYSPRTAAVYADCLAASAAAARRALVRVPHLALSERVAAPLRKAGIGEILVSPRPHEDAILTLVEDSLKGRVAER
jgi:uroporphyrinogen-III synthase